MKLKMTVTYGDILCEYLKETFGCETDDELLIVFRALMKQALAKEAIDEDDLTIVCEKIYEN
jgi:hypothetical protein